MAENTTQMAENTQKLRINIRFNLVVPMRVAIQISGQQRYGSFFPEFLKVVSTTFKNIDFFFHHWDGPRNKEQISNLIAGTNATVVDVKFEPQIQFKVKPEWELLHPQGSSIFNLMSMTYGIYEANKLRIEHQNLTGTKYDLVIRARPDIRLHDMPQSTWFENIGNDTISIGVRPWWLSQGKPEIQDQIAIGKPETIDKYSRLYGAFDKFHGEGRKFHPETYFYWWINTNNIKADESMFSVEIEKHAMRREERAVY